MPYVNNHDVLDDTLFVAVAFGDKRDFGTALLGWLLGLAKRRGRAGGELSELGTYWKSFHHSGGRECRLAFSARRVAMSCMRTPTSLYMLTKSEK